MDKDLNISLKSLPSCEMYIEDNSDYSTLNNLNKYFLVEYLEQNNTIIEQRVVAIGDIGNSILEKSEPFTSINGLQTAVRIAVPSFEIYKTGSNYLVANKYFILDNEVYFSTQNVTELTKDNLVLIEDYSVLLKSNQPDIYIGKDTIFSYCTLKNCVLEKLKNEIANFKKQGCDFNCTNKENYELNFLIESLYAVEILVDQNKLSDAQRVLDTIIGCGSLCNSGEIENTDCGCGKS